MVIFGLMGNEFTTEESPNFGDFLLSQNPSIQQIPVQTIIFVKTQHISEQPIKLHEQYLHGSCSANL